MTHLRLVFRNKKHCADAESVMELWTSVKRAIRHRAHRETIVIGGRSPLAQAARADRSIKVINNLEITPAKSASKIMHPVRHA